MANTLGTVTVAQRGRQQYQALWSDYWQVSVPVSGQDAVADDVSVSLTCTVPGVALGDVVLAIGINKNLADENASVSVDAWVSAANTLSIKWTNVDETTDAYDADTLTDGVFKILIGRPAW